MDVAGDQQSTVTRDPREAAFPSRGLAHRRRSLEQAIRDGVGVAIVDRRRIGHGEISAMRSTTPEPVAVEIRTPP